MRRLALALTLLLAAGPALAQAPTSAADAMQRLAFLHGTWRGEGTTTAGPGPHGTSAVLETAQPKLGGTALLVEGIGWLGTQGAADYRVVHEALAVISYDAAKGEYAMRAYRGGEYIDADITVSDGEVVWGFTPPGSPGRIRYTIRLDEQGRWHEVGDFSPDGGATWHRFFEMRLRKET